MININELSDNDIGRWVVYTDGVGSKQNGKIKSYNDEWIFVVYHCDDRWDSYYQYTGAATRPEDLQFIEDWSKEIVKVKQLCNII